MMIKIWHIAVFVAALVLFGAASAPARLLAPESGPGFEYSRVSGAIWNARFEGVVLSGLPAGTVTVRISPLDVVQGKVIADVAALGGAGFTGSGQVLANIHGDRRLVVREADVRVSSLAGVPLSGGFRIEGVDAFFSKGKCERAQGMVTTDIPERNPGYFGEAARTLAGGVSCEGEAAIVRLQDAAYAMEISLRADGGGAVLVRARPGNEQINAVAGGAGLAPSPDGEWLEATRRIRWFPA